jgi:alanyl-tRNA synthetase
MGSVSCTIDLPADSISRQQLEEAEDLANRIVGENRNVGVRYVSHENIAEAGLRKATERTGDIRVIDIDDYDRSACGGTHVRRIGEIGPVLIIGTERAKKQTRVEFICGLRVLKYARQANRTLESISQTVSAAPFDTASAVRTLWDEHQNARKRIEELESELIDYEAARFPVSEGLAVKAFKNRGIEKLKLLAAKICSRPGMIALLADEGDQLRIVFARSADSGVDVAAVLKKTLERFGGRGGGRPNLAQGGGLTGDPQEILEFAQDICRLELPS